jgi:predicted phosphodiesterase
MTIGIWVMSDLHNEFPYGGRTATGPAYFPAPDGADLLVIAGDYNRADRIISNARQQFPEIPVVIIAGNHEYYKTGSGQLGSVMKMRAAAKADREQTGRQTYFLENETVELSFRGETLRVIGSTLWTDFDVLGDPEGHMEFAATAMNDYAYIKSNLSPFNMVLPREVRQWHRQSHKFIGDTLRQPFQGRTVVVTHHLPCARSIAEKYKSDPLTACYASNCADLLYLKPDLWIHGHQHSSVDYRFGPTRVISNPRGYPDYFKGSAPENPNFKRDLVIEV